MSYHSARAESWVTPKVIVKHSPVEGKGLFVQEPIAEGESVLVFGGRLFTREEFLAGKVKPETDLQVDENLYLGSAHEEPSYTDEFLNHSCEPNVWLSDAITMIAIRDLEPGEELFADYGTFEGFSTARMNCCCGAEHCRMTITGDDWMRPDLQECYGEHFSPYLLIRQERLGEQSQEDQLLAAEVVPA